MPGKRSKAVLNGFEGLRRGAGADCGALAASVGGLAACVRAVPRLAVHGPVLGPVCPSLARVAIRIRQNVTLVTNYTLWTGHRRTCPDRRQCVTIYGRMAGRFNDGWLKPIPLYFVFLPRWGPLRRGAAGRGRLPSDQAPGLVLPQAAHEQAGGAPVRQVAHVVQHVRQAVQGGRSAAFPSE